MAETTLNVVVETGSPLGEVFGRTASIKIGGVTIFSQLVHDSDRDGYRTTEQAVQNVLTLFGSRVRALLEDD